MLNILGLGPVRNYTKRLFSNSEELLPTAHPKIKQVKYQLLDWEKISHYVDIFSQMYATHENEDKFRNVLTEMVPEFNVTNN
ncbi:MAG: hypothetical protein LBL17_04825 [Coxiellaceae bacterium]|jgi:hypothetical protein|nr:hypothetical protein [Coxiellaceae bacterium]